MTLFKRIIPALLAVALLGTQVHAAEQSAPVPVVNVNTATVSQLALLPGVGKVISVRIADYRTEHGPFKVPSDLLQVKGIGEKKFATMKLYVAVSGETTATAKIRVAKDGAK